MQLYLLCWLHFKGDNYKPTLEEWGGFKFDTLLL